jgi:hypothetical protein
VRSATSRKTSHGSPSPIALLAGQIAQPQQELAPQNSYLAIQPEDLIFQPLPSNQSKEALPLFKMNGRCHFGLLEQRIETTSKVVSILIG